MAIRSRMHTSNLLFLPPEIIQIIVDHLGSETIQLLMAAPKLAHLVTDKHLAYQDRWGCTILHCAVFKNAEAIVNLIARRCAQDQATTCRYYTPLHLAISLGLDNIAKILIDAGVDLLAKDLSGRTALHRACSESGRRSNLVEIVQLMLAKGVDTSIVAHFKETPLHVILEADWNPNLTVIQMVVDAGVDVNTLDRAGFSSLWWSVTNGHEDAFELLLAQGAEPHISTNQGTILHEAVACERENLVEWAVELGVDLSLRDNGGNTALMLAI
ncbi:hypothetical protein CNMCM5793_003518 [Aspergillus hiratsukae]|uniref:Ankyrin repeat-containing domain protein n=1 Tax=Aspergillus hiratsukae TaxID=1194566 RepID=A0A8H6UFX5_9EURO|nr:hypothetical protein CNMCM5793_003518 [Aspergillus hiratsukae]KAF7171364.1 hypothetical protein CNMCM6106_005778 [Aspergillus hiratsukae]